MQSGLTTEELEKAKEAFALSARRFERVARLAQEAAMAARGRAAAAEGRKEAAAHRIADLGRYRVHPVRPPEEAAARLARAEITAADAHKLAIEEYEHAAVAHEETAGAHQRAAELIETRGDHERASWHRLAAARACDAAMEARREAQVAPP